VPPRSLRDALRLLVVTDPKASGGRPLLAVVEAALRGGAGSVQLRDKVAGTGTLLPLARGLRERCHAHGALFFVNDRVDLALAAGADGVHIGQDDLPLEAVRRLVPEGFLVGVSAETPELARSAQAGGADYVGAGPVWPTDSKTDAGAAIGVEGVARVVAATSLPVVAIGGITPERAPGLWGAGAAGVAVIRAILAAPDPEEAARSLVAGAPPDAG
jgi:thiamine-phosphate pyrophosphorylase